MIDHRGAEFAQLLGQVSERLRALFQTQGDVLLLTGSGTGGLEAAIVNTLSPGDVVLAVSVGAFGDRFAEIAQAHGAQVHLLSFARGQDADPERVRQALQNSPGVKALLVTHNESSTGVANDMRALGALAREFGVLCLVDSISGLGALELPVDDWGCDVVVTASQKAWMAPPGLAMVSVNARAWEAYRTARMPRFYWDFRQAQRYAERGQTPWTPALSVLFGLDTALGMIQAEGPAAVIERHCRVARHLRKGVKELGLLLLPEERCASNTVTAVRAPEGLDIRALRRRCEEEHQVVLAGGQGELEGKIFRVGHMGWVTEEDIDGVLDALRRVLPDLGFQPGRA